MCLNIIVKYVFTVNETGLKTSVCRIFTSKNGLVLT